MASSLIARNKKKYNLSFYLRWMLAMMLGTLLIQLWTSHIWRVQAVRFEGNYRFTQEYIASYFKEKAILGQHLLAIHPLTIKQDLLSNKILQDIQVERRLFPASIVLKVRERKPAFQLFLLNSTQNVLEKSILIDLEGQTLPLKIPVQMPAIPLKYAIKQELIKDRLSEKHILALHQFNELSQTLNFPKGYLNLSDPDNVILNTPISPAPVWLGNAQNMSRKLGLLPSVIAAANKSKGVKHYLDLRFWKHPVIRSKTFSNH